MAKRNFIERALLRTGLFARGNFGPSFFLPIGKKRIFVLDFWTKGKSPKGKRITHYVSKPR